MAVYNAQQWLSASIGSMMNQSLRDWQLICIDDASTDETLRILRQYAEADARILQMISFLSPVTANLSETQKADIESALSSML